MTSNAPAASNASLTAASNAPAFIRARAVNLERALDQDVELYVAKRGEVAGEVRAARIDYLRATRVRLRSLPDLQFFIERLQLLNDRLEGKAEPVEAIALVRRKRAREYQSASQVLL